MHEPFEVLGHPRPAALVPCCPAAPPPPCPGVSGSRRARTAGPRKAGPRAPPALPPDARIGRRHSHHLAAFCVLWDARSPLAPQGDMGARCRSGRPGPDGSPRTMGGRAGAAGPVRVRVRIVQAGGKAAEGISGAR
ncbi:hypothetical protein GCM10018781_31380 [Kitasatospora indigofera]|uniref:Uncharacterized protein n=1 Tax=Kitasatospora indigofera TaxID=67307 RepID=A0A919FSE9_9ACTN|nr:hypothetical protein GCM10018781_31380 [Kitasatospora indigofera]